MLIYISINNVYRFVGIRTSSLSTDSNRNSICTSDESPSIYSSLIKSSIVGYAKAIQDCTPCPYLKNALAFKVWLYFTEHILYSKMFDRKEISYQLYRKMNRGLGLA